MRTTYRILVEGRNCTVQGDNSDRKMGFYWTVFVTAENETAAKSQALQRAMGRLAPALSSARTAEPVLGASHVEEVPATEIPDRDHGMAWFVE